MKEKNTRNKLDTFSHFHPSLLFIVEARSLPLEGSPIRGSTLALPNTLAYYDTATITAVKSFTVQAPGPVL